MKKDRPKIKVLPIPWYFKYQKNWKFMLSNKDYDPETQYRKDLETLTNGGVLSMDSPLDYLDEVEGDLPFPKRMDIAYYFREEFPNTNKDIFHQTSHRMYCYIFDRWFVSKQSSSELELYVPCMSHYDYLKIKNCGIDARKYLSKKSQLDFEYYEFEFKMDKGQRMAMARSFKRLGLKRNKVKPNKIWK